MRKSIVDKQYTIEEYLAIEERTKSKHEFFNGYIRQTDSATFFHNLVATNVVATIGTALWKKNFHAMSSNMKIYIPHFHAVIYPDALVVCEKIELYNNREDVIINPLLIAEVSDCTKEQRRLKYHYYKTIPAFKEYVLVDRTRPHAVASYRTAEDTWHDSSSATMDGSIYLRSVGCIIAMKDLYHKTGVLN